MIYYCIYKNECLHKKCVYRETKSKFSTIGDKEDLTINEFTCNLTGRKRTRLISDERIICDRYKECGTNCLLKNVYITISNFKEYFAYKFDPSKPLKCYGTGFKVNLMIAGENAGNYINIWDQPNLFSKKNEEWRIT